VEIQLSLSGISPKHKVQDTLTTHPRGNLSKRRIMAPPTLIQRYKSRVVFPGDPGLLLLCTKTDNFERLLENIGEPVLRDSIINPLWKDFLVYVEVAWWPE